MPEPLNALGAQVAAQTRALDECQQERDGARLALRAIIGTIEGTDGTYVYRADSATRELDILAIAKKALKEAGQ